MSAFFKSSARVLILIVIGWGLLYLGQIFAKPVSLFFFQAQTAQRQGMDFISFSKGRYAQTLLNQSDTHYSKKEFLESLNAADQALDLIGNLSHLGMLRYHLYFTKGLCLDELGYLYNAELAIKKAYRIAEKQFGKHSKQADACHSVLARVYESAGDYTQAKYYGEKALLTLERQEPAGNRLKLLITLSHVYFIEHNFQQLINVDERMIAEYTQTLGPVHSDIAVLYTDIGASYFQLKQYPKAEQAFETAITMFEKVHPPELSIQEQALQKHEQSQSSDKLRFIFKTFRALHYLYREEHQMAKAKALEERAKPYHFPAPISE